MKKTSLVLILLFYSAFVCSEGYKSIDDEIFSKVLNENRSITIMVPEQQDGNEKLDVLYLTDAEMFQKYVANILEFQHENSLVPPQIIVGIPNIWEWPNLTRDRDLTPVENTELPVVSGQAEKFQDFLEQELIPYIDSKYPNNNKRTLLGHSYGGLFTLFTYLTRPHMFDSYIASDPSCYFVDHYVSSIVRKHVAQHDYSNKTLFIGGRSGQQHEDMGTKRFIEELEKYTPENLVWQERQYKDEHHGSVRFKGFYDGLKFTFYGSNKDELEFHPMNGILLKDRPLDVKTYSDNKLARYTLDGTVPSRNSKQLAQVITIQEPSQLTVKFFSNRTDDQVVRAAFDYAEPIANTDIPKNSSKGELQASYYDVKNAVFTELTTADLLISKAIKDNDFPLEKMPEKGGFTAGIAGYLQIQTDGYHTFYLSSDNHAKLYLGKKPLIDFEKSTSRFGSKSFVVPLTKGFYALNIEYFHHTGRGWVDLTYKTPQMTAEQDPMKIPLDYLWSAQDQ